MDTEERFPCNQVVVSAEPQFRSRRSQMPEIKANPMHCMSTSEVPVSIESFHRLFSLQNTLQLLLEILDLSQPSRIMKQNNKYFNTLQVG